MSLITSTVNCLEKFSNYKWSLKLVSKRLFDKGFAHAMLNNRHIKDSHKGERCFIVGNGPSIRNMDLSKLENEFVFTVNDIFRNDAIFRAMKSNCHVFVDPEYAKMTDGQLIDYVTSVSKYRNDILCVCSEAMFLKNKLFDDKNISAIFSYMHRYWLAGNEEIDFTKNVYIAQNVVQAAIYVALYMGFSEIIILGCEMTSFYENLEYNATGRLIENHAYSYTESDKNAYKAGVTQGHDNHYMLQDYSITFSIFKSIRNYADSHSVRIVNATVGGILDMFDRVEYNSLFC